MTKAQIISKTLREMKPAPEPADYEIVVAELHRRLPDGTDVKTCEDFRQLGVKCCETCHEFYPHYEMKLIDLPDGSPAWVCDEVEWAIYPGAGCPTIVYRELSGEIQVLGVRKWPRMKTARA